MKFLGNGKKNMDNKKYKIVLSPIFINETEDIFLYISEKLYESNTAKKFLNQINSKVQLLKFYPNMYPKLKVKQKLYKILRKIIIGNYVIIYMVNEKKLQVNILHIYYQGENYLYKI